VAKLAQDFDIPTLKLTTVLENRQKNFSLFLIRLYTKAWYSKWQS